MWGFSPHGTKMTYWEVPQGKSAGNFEKMGQASRRRGVGGGWAGLEGCWAW